MANSGSNSFFTETGQVKMNEFIKSAPSLLGDTVAFDPYKITSMRFSQNEMLDLPAIPKNLKEVILRRFHLSDIDFHPVFATNFLKFFYSNDSATAETKVKEAIIFALSTIGYLSDPDLSKSFKGLVLVENLKFEEMFNFSSENIKTGDGIYGSVEGAPATPWEYFEHVFTNYASMNLSQTGKTVIGRLMTIKNYQHVLEYAISIAHGVMRLCTKNANVASKVNFALITIDKPDIWLSVPELQNLKTFSEGFAQEIGYWAAVVSHVFCQRPQFNKISREYAGMVLLRLHFAKNSLGHYCQRIKNIPGMTIGHILEKGVMKVNEMSMLRLMILSGLIGSNMKSEFKATIPYLRLLSTRFFANYSMKQNEHMIAILAGITSKDSEMEAFITQTNFTLSKEVLASLFQLGQNIVAQVQGLSKEQLQVSDRPAEKTFFQLLQKNETAMNAPGARINPILSLYGNAPNPQLPLNANIPTIPANQGSSSTTGTIPAQARTPPPIVNNVQASSGTSSGNGNDAINNFMHHFGN